MELNHKFDLKGSTYGRKASKKEREKAHPTFKVRSVYQSCGSGPTFIVVDPMNPYLINWPHGPGPVNSELLIRFRIRMLILIIKDSKKYTKIFQYFVIY